MERETVMAKRDVVSDIIGRYFALRLAEAVSQPTSTPMHSLSAFYATVALRKIGGEVVIQRLLEITVTFYPTNRTTLPQAKLRLSLPIIYYFVMFSFRLYL